mgnify:CR=1 FL=1
MKAMHPPIILVNFKAYPEAMGDKALEKARIAEEVSEEKGICIIVAPPLVDLALVAREVSIPVFAQHVDPVEPGRRTGHVPPESILAAGATGTLVNHAEKRLDYLEIKMIVDRCKELGLMTLVCCARLRYCNMVVRLGPDMFAFEPPELIGTGRSVTSEKPESLRKAMRIAKSLKPDIIAMCGAGVSCGKDVRDAIMLGAEGVLVGSVVRRPDFKDLLSEMADAALKAWDEKAS